MVLGKQHSDGPKGLERGSYARDKTGAPPQGINHGYYNRGGNLLWMDIEYAVACMANSLHRHNAKPRGIIGVSRGGLIPAVMLSHLMEVPYICDLYSKTYSDKMLETTQLHWDPAAKDEINNPNNLVVDDIWDSGTTHQAFRQAFPDGTFATLFYKEKAAQPHSHMVVNFPGLALREGEWVKFPWEVK